MVLESNNKSNEVDLACVFLFPKYKRGPHLSKHGVGQSKLQKPNGKKSALFRETKQVLQETRYSNRGSHSEQLMSNP